MVELADKGFRPEIEGLRAIAVLPILLFHLNAALCPGGYIGVDIFFVISGYLITRMIIAAGSDFSFAKFYTRRFFRLFPALLATCQVSLIIGWFILSPADYLPLAQSALASLFGVSNFYFHLTLDYFNNENIYHPLLHTWSLGVEEQFYLLWPALIFVFLKLRTHYLLPLLVLAVLPFLLASLGQNDNSTLAFYMMPFRIFEFAAGAALLYLEPYWHRLSTRLVNGIAGLFGAALLIYANTYFDDRVVWPGLYTLVPVIGTALLILCGREGIWHAILANPLFRAIGRISYSLYLVHWPVIVFYRYYAVLPPSPVEITGLAIVCIVLAALMYLFVEVPFRQGALVLGSSGASEGREKYAALKRFWRRARGPFIAVSSLLFIAAGLLIIVQKGFVHRVNSKTVQNLDKGLTFAGDLCDAKRNRCVFGDRQSSDVVYLVGDSHALNLVYGLDQLFKKSGLKGIALTDHGCFFAMGTTRFQKGRRDERCAKNIEQAFAHLATNRDPVIFAMDYAGYRNDIGDRQGEVALRQGPVEYYRWLGQKTRASLDHIDASQRKIILVKQTYDTGIHLQKCLFRHNRSTETDQAGKCPTTSRRQTRKQYQKADHMIEELARALPSTYLIDPKTLFCQKETCKTSRNNRLFFRDTAHLTNNGSVYLVEAMSEGVMAYLRGR